MAQPATACGTRPSKRLIGSTAVCRRCFRRPAGALATPNPCSPRARNHPVCRRQTTRCSLPRHATSTWRVSYSKWRRSDLVSDAGHFPLYASQPNGSRAPSIPSRAPTCNEYRCPDVDDNCSTGGRSERAHFASRGSPSTTSSCCARTLRATSFCRAACGAACRNEAARRVRRHPNIRR